MLQYNRTYLKWYLLVRKIQQLEKKNGKKKDKLNNTTKSKIKDCNLWGNLAHLQHEDMHSQNPLGSGTTM